MPGAKKKLLIVTLVVVFALSFAAFLRSNYVVPVLMYHSVNPRSDYALRKLIVSPQSFERQMRFLKENNYNVVTLEELGELLGKKKKLPPKTVAITFDDGYRDNYTYAFPVLKKYNLPATIFVIINEIGRPQGDRLGWEEIKQMQASGLVTIGSHTLSHAWLPDPLSDDSLRSEIFGSKALLEEKLGKAINCFSYPGGRFNKHIRNLVQQAGYRVAVATNPGKKYPSDDLLALKRLRISPSCDNLFVFWFESNGYYNFIRENRHK